MQNLTGLIQPILFLKATVKKQVWVPGFTRHDGVVVQGHYAMVHVTDDHDEHKILAGQGSYSQKAAHKHLTKHEWFNTLPHDHKIAILQEHATALQDKDSNKAVLAVFKKKILAAQYPSNSEWKAFDQAPAEKKAAIHAEAESAGLLMHLTGGYAKWVSAQPAPEPDTGAHIAALLDKIAAAKLPESNTNHKVVNGKLATLAAAVSAANTKTILSTAYGNNTYAQKIVKLANEALAALGSEHQVTPSQKAGAHPSLTNDKPKAPRVVAASVSAPEVPPAPAMPAPSEIPEAFNDNLPVKNFIHTLKSAHKQHADSDPTHWIDPEDVAGYHALSDADKKIADDAVEAISPEAKGSLAKWKAAQQAASDAKAAAEVGPKDGDTKPGTDGVMLVFNNGRWHKSKPTPTHTSKELKKLAATVPIPKLSGSYAMKMGKTMKQLKAIAEKYGGEKLAEYIKVMPAGTIQVGNKFATDKLLSISWGAYSLTHPNTNAQALVNYAKQLLDVMGGTIGDGATAPANKVVGATAEQPYKPTVAVSKTEKDGKLSIAIADDWEQTGPQKGSNPGGKFKDKGGREWYCKFPGDPDVVKNELLAAKFYQMLGAKVPTLKLVKKDGKLGIASKWVDGLKKGSAEQLAKADGAHNAFVFDAWLANWDVVGASNDNLLLDKHGKAVRVDVGGSLLYRAQGGPKGDAFGETVPELETLLDAAKNDKSAAVFNGVNEQAIRDGVNQLNKLKPSQIMELCAIAGPGTEADRAALAEKLIARRAFILKTLNKNDQWDKPVVDDTKIDVNPADIQAPIDFHHHPEKGGGALSSKDWLNTQNSKDSEALVEFAKKGNLKALKDYEYDAVDHATGKSIGKKPITSHPSNHIQKQWASLVQTLQSIAYPPAETLDMPSFGVSGAIDEIAHQVGSFAPTENVTTVPAEHRLGYFMKLAQADSGSISDLVTDKNWSFIKDNDAFVEKGKENYKQCSAMTKAYISSVQSSGAANHLWSQGKASFEGHPIKALTKAIYDDAIEVPEGSQMWRWMDDDTADDIMTKQLNASHPGAILQNTDSMCTSFKQAWGEKDMPHFCGEPKKAILMRIRCAKGAMVTPSYGSGNHWGERELTTLPGARFLVVSVTKGDHRHPDGVMIDCIMLPPDDGFIAQLGPEMPLTKAIFWSNLECNKQPSITTVFLRAPSQMSQRATI